MPYWLKRELETDHVRNKTDSLYHRMPSSVQTTCLLSSLVKLLVAFLYPCQSPLCSPLPPLSFHVIWKKYILYLPLIPSPWNASPQSTGSWPADWGRLSFLLLPTSCKKYRHKEVTTLQCLRIVANVIFNSISRNMPFVCEQWRVNGWHVGPKFA